jgi:hypothetical protein
MSLLLRLTRNSSIRFSYSKKPFCSSHSLESPSPYLSFNSLAPCHPTSLLEDKMTVDIISQAILYVSRTPSWLLWLPSSTLPRKRSWKYFRVPMGTVGSNTDFLPAPLSYLCYFAYSNSRSCHRSSSSALALFSTASRRTTLPTPKLPDLDLGLEGCVEIWR